ncbi:uncharacterized protein (DUF305 family) [Lentzea atacamensis]|uniref:Uncharacterized protein (DUF305 family) n=1 Tax=Lentzea atacamensis TaxID=531938 RepID=A0A316IQR2_9PSEU|nr:DUF305 domain-containing protein [Lentzea atacamensis]PWK89475.1 uncharacterized protein (DUF305 family) [Lentzea atacamensis]RAS60689.1 uncharacterized protein (DUF305 family) [Lentzea atacamensis]
MTSPETSESERPSGVARTLVITAAVLAVLLLGAAIGLLVKLPGSTSSAAPASGSVDVGFCQDMAVHHLQGIQMANIARDRSTDPDIRQLAFDIASTQLEQVGRMKGWLMMWNEHEQSPDGVYMAWMNDAGIHGHGATTATPGQPLMPGMATTEELTKLRGLSGRDLEVYFLQLMIRHHVGGAPMAEYAARQAGQPFVRTLADNMLKSQTSELDVMKDYLAKRGAAPLP